MSESLRVMLLDTFSFVNISFALGLLAVAYGLHVAHQKIHYFLAPPWKREQLKKEDEQDY